MAHNQETSLKHSLFMFTTVLGPDRKKLGENTFTLHNSFSLKFVQSSVCLNARRIGT